MITIHKCLRCGHEWPSRLEKLPKQCPKCRSPYWNKPKVKQSGPRRTVIEAGFNSTFPWEGVVAEYLLSRPKASRSDSDNYTSVWIAFNSWMKGNFGTRISDRELINATKAYQSINDTFNHLKGTDIDFAEDLDSFSNFEVKNERNSKIFRYDGSFDSLLETLYAIRGNIVHGTDFSGMNNECHRLAYQILYVLLYKQIFPERIPSLPWNLFGGR